MKKRILLAMGVAALAAAAGKSYSVELYQPVILGSTELSPGTYRLEVTDQKAVVSKGKIHGEAAVKVEAADSKYSTTSVRLSNNEGKMHIEEIHIGGTKTKLIFGD